MLKVANTKDQIQERVRGQLITLMLVQAIIPTLCAISFYYHNFMLVIWTIYVAFPVADMILPLDQWNPE